MAKLADVTSEVRIVLKLLAAAAVVVTLVFIFFQGGAFFKNTFFPTPPPPPDQKFGELPPIPFPAMESESLDYNVNTLTGKLPQFSDRTNVFEISYVEPSLTALETARNKLELLGYKNSETKIGDTLYQWINDKGERIQYDLLTNNFTITSNYINDAPPQILTGDASTKEGAFDTAMEFLSNMGIDTGDLDPGKSIASYLKLVNGQLVKADSQADAQFLRLDIFQKPIDDEYEIYYPTLPSSMMYFLFRSDSSIPRIVDAKFMHYVYNKDAVATYPLKTAEEAFEDLQKENAYILNQSGEKVIDITDVKLGYYLSSDDPKYLMPVIVFLGNNFTAFVPAVPGTIIQPLENQ